MLILFTEKDGSVSWRKIMTAVASFCFAFSVMGFLFGLPELPASYQAIISGVFVFYFGKEIMRKVKITS